MSTYEPHWNLAQYLCPVCLQHHPLNPITFTSECCSMDPLRQCMLQACPPRFDVITAVSWETQDVINRRHFICSLVPPSLADMFSTHPVGRCLAEHKEDLRPALVKRRPALTNILHEILNHLREHQPPLSRPPSVSLNPWGVPQAVYSTTRHPPPNVSHQYLPPPPLPASVSEKQKPSKKTGHPPSDPPLQPAGKRQRV